MFSPKALIIQAARWIGRREISRQLCRKDENPPKSQDVWCLKNPQKLCFKCVKKGEQTVDDKRDLFNSVYYTKIESSKSSQCPKGSVKSSFSRLSVFWEQNKLAERLWWHPDGHVGWIQPQQHRARQKKAAVRAIYTLAFSFSFFSPQTLDRHQWKTKCGCVWRNMHGILTSEPQVQHHEHQSNTHIYHSRWLLSVTKTWIHTEKKNKTVLLLRNSPEK